ncbi:MAG: trans-sulfuration enzyme family protein [Ilumatobacteraceae bacterium]
MTDSPETTAVTAGRGDSGSLAPALWPTTVWQTEGLDDTSRRATGVRQGGLYSRYSNPTVRQFEEAVAALEGAESALAFASGMGAIASVVLALCGNGSHIVAQNNLYGATMSFLRGPCTRFGIDVTFVEPTTRGSFAAAVQPGRTMLVIAESPSNPRLALTDLSELGAIKGPFTMVDSTMATPLGQHPLDFGVDMVLHSATKGIGGHNDALLGVVAGSADLLDEVWAYSVMHGAVASPHDALNALRGMRTLAVRTAHQHTTALRLGDALASHARVRSTIHPFLESHPQHRLARAQMRMGGTLLALDIDGGTDACRSVISRLRLARPATSFGGPETLVCHPATSTHAGLSVDDLSAMQVSDGLLRVSVGLENADDLLADFTQALAG